MSKTKNRRRACVRVLFAMAMLMLAFRGWAAASAAQPALTLVDGDGVVYVILSNHADQPIKLRKDFLLDSLVGSLSFQISRDKTDFPQSATINPILPTESTYMVLRPGAITGRVVGHWELAAVYGMGAGCYQVAATYLDRGAEKFAALSVELHAPPIRVCIGDDESGIPLTLVQAGNLAKSALHGIGSLADGWSVAEAKSAGDFYSFDVHPSNEVVSEIFVERRTAEVWMFTEARCTRYERKGLSALYAPRGEAPEVCRASP